MAVSLTLGTQRLRGEVKTCKHYFLDKLGCKNYGIVAIRSRMTEMATFDDLPNPRKPYVAPYPCPYFGLIRPTSAVVISNLDPAALTPLGNATLGK
jgi:hypothetical protein